MSAMAGQSDRIFSMMTILVTVLGIISGIWWLPLAAQLLNFEKFFIQYLHHREPDLIRLFDFLVALFCMPAPRPTRRLSSLCWNLDRRKGSR
jgi:hypothetical protein